MGQRAEMTYDPVGNMATATDFNGDTITYSYDPLNQMVAKHFPDTTTIEYAYTPAGQISTVTDQRGDTTYQYDQRDRLIERIDPDGKFIRYTYDAGSNRTAVITPGGTTTYTYDKFNQPETVTDPNNGVTRYSYDNAGNLIETALPNNTVETREYDPLNQLVSLKNSLVDATTSEELEVISSYSYSLDPVGNRLEVLAHDGRTVEYDYDDLYRLTQEKISDAETVQTIDYTYDPVGNMLTRNGSDGLTAYSYNANDWLLSETVDGQTTTYAYDDNGNTISRIEDGTNLVEYGWDYENRLISAEVTNSTGTSSAQYQYDANGVRVASIVDGQETRYLIDTNRAYAQVLEEYVPDGTVEVFYVYGQDLISQKRSGQLAFYHVDGLGSTIALTDALGNVTDRYIYDAYGNLQGSTGSTVNNYLYTGEQYDPNLENYYLRARYYNPSTGRFISRDPFEGFLSEPLSLSDYPYVHGNPINAIDPTGLFRETTTALKIKSILTKVAIITAGGLGAAGIIATATRSEWFILAVSKKVATWCALAGNKNCSTGIPIVFYGDKFQGGPLVETTKHINEAINGKGSNNRHLKPVVAAITRATAPSTHGPKDWYRRKTPECDKAAKDKAYADTGAKHSCDEYPFYTTEEGGRENYSKGNVSLKLVPDVESGPQGALMNEHQLNAADVVPGDNFKKWYGVVPVKSGLPISFWVPRNEINTILDIGKLFDWF